jgi:Putative auto-transporter adhesin, head GIN domain
VRKTASFLCAGLALLIGSACDDGGRHFGPTRMLLGSGSLATETRPVRGFDGVSASGAARLIIRQTGAESLEVTAEENVLPALRTEVAGGTLSLGFDPLHAVHPTHEVLYRLTVRELNTLEAAGACLVEVTDLETDRLEVVLAGASILTAAGRADRLGVELSGASLMHAGGLESRSVTARLSGASYARIRVRDRLEASVSGASILEYVGDPVVVASVSGGGIVRRAGS